MPSIFSFTTGVVSWENQQKIEKADDFAHRHLGLEKKRSSKERSEYWSGSSHLASKLREVIDEVVALRPGFDRESLSIVEGTGEVVMKRGDVYHYVDVQDDSIYVSPGILPSRMINKLRRSKELDL